MTSGNYDSKTFSPEQLAELFKGGDGVENKPAETEKISEEDNTEEIIKRISRVTSMKYSDEQLKILRHRGGMNIVACAGSGKTTILTHLLAKRVLTGEIANTNKLLCTTYSRAGAIEMEERIEKLFKQLGIRSTITVKTLHAFYLMVLKHFGFTVDVIDNSTRMRFILESCRGAGIGLGDEDLQLIDSLLSYQINNLLSDDALVKSYVYTLENVNKAQYTAIRSGYNKRKEEKRLIDFDDMQLYMYNLLVNQRREDMLAYCRAHWTDFYVDEAQDISKIQFAILRELITDHDKMVFIGDDDQCVYEWRGADPSIILDICGVYDIQRFILSTNYRCYGNIVRPAARGIANNTKRSEKTMRPFYEGGQIRVCDTGGGSLYQQSKYAYKHIRDLVMKEGVNPSDIAVLSRNNQHLSIINNLLFKNGIYCEAAQDMKFTGTAMYRDMRNVIEIAKDSRNHNITATTLWRICPYLGTRTSLAIAQLQEFTGVKISDALGYILTKHLNRKVDWNKSIKIPVTAEARIEAFMNKLSYETMNYLKIIYDLIKGKNDVKKVSGLLSLYLEGTSFIYKGQDRERSAEGMVEYILDLLKELGMRKMESFLRASEQFEKGRMAVPGDKVCMTTMHSSKGREWKHVVLFADDNITSPSFEGILNMGMRGVSIGDISANIDENRRLHYVAMTRAKEDLTIFTDKNNISVYTLEAFGIKQTDKNVANAHIISMANSGALYQDLITEAEKRIFNKESEYYYEVDISDLESDSYVDYMGEDSEEYTKGDSLDDIKIMDAISFGDDSE